MPSLAFPQLPSTLRLRGTNIVPRAADTGNGGYATPANFYDLLYDWGTSNGDPWNDWIKPQIDAAAASGCNLVRFMFDATVRVG